MNSLKNSVKTLLFFLYTFFPLVVNASNGAFGHHASGFLGSDEYDTLACFNALEAENRMESVYPKECTAEVVCVQTTEDSKSPEVNVDTSADTTQEISETSEEKPYFPLRSGKRREKELDVNKKHEKREQFSFARKVVMLGSFFLIMSALIATQS